MVLSSCFAGTPYSDQIIQKPASAQGDVYYAPPPVREGERIQGTVDVGSSLNVRSGPWGDILGTLGDGDKLTIVGQTGDWYKVEYRGKIAYVHSTYVKRPGEKEKPFPRSGWVNAPLGLNVRRVPHGDIIGKLKDQTGVEIIGVIGDFYKIKYGDNEAFVSRKYIDTDQPAKPPSNSVKPENFIGFVSAEDGLNVRTSPWGPIATSLPFGIAVQVTGKIDDWYQINYNGKVRYVHANFISKTKPGVGQPGNNQPPSNIPAGDRQARIAAEARKLVGSTKFRGREVDYGNLACAQVVSTALVRAGAMDKVVLNVRSIVKELHSKGWKEVSVPPFMEGDVITWMTYDYTGDGKKDPDTHVGIMVKEGNSFKAMNNSSRLRTPRMTDPYAIGPVTRVMRKVA